MRFPSLSTLSSCGFTRRCLFSMHSDDATMIFGPGSLVVSASRKRVAHLGDIIGPVDLPHPGCTDALHRIDNGIVGLSLAD